eukprot:1206076-Ditylum_brightwellii.AAC.1
MEKCFTEAREKRAIKAQAFATTKRRSTLFQDQHNQDKLSLLPDLNTPSDQRPYYTGHNKSRAKCSYIGRGSCFEVTLTGPKDDKKQDGNRDMDLVFTWNIRTQYEYVWHNEVFEFLHSAISLNHENSEPLYPGNIVLEGFTELVVQNKIVNDVSDADGHLISFCAHPNYKSKKTGIAGS